MLPDDPRHGTRRGYYAHRRAGEQACDPCKRGAAAAEARYEHNRMHGIPGRLSPIGTQRRLRALVALGYTWASLDRYMGHRMAEKFGSGRLNYVFPSTHEKVCEVYERLAMKHPPQTTPTEKAAVTKATNMARRNGWPPPLAWDDIDDPDEQPRDWQYRPASRVDTLAELVEHGAGITEACRVLKIGREGLEKWCQRHGMSAEFRVLAGRETAVFEYANQYTTGVAS